MTVKEIELKIAEVVHELNNLRAQIIREELTDQNLPNTNRNRVHTEILKQTASRFADYVLTGK